MATPTYGEITLTATRGPLVGRTLHPRSDLKIKDIGGKTTVGTNLNGTIYREFEPGAARFEMSIQRTEPRLSKADFLAEHDFVLEEVSLGKAHFIRNAVLDGEYEASGKNGELSGIAIVCAARDHDERAL